MSDFKRNIERYAVGKSWYWYLPLWLFGVYVLFELFQFNPPDPMPPVLIVPYSFDFMLHEWAHIFTAFLPSILTASAGSFSELLLGTVLVVMAFWQRSYFASMFCLLWFGLTFQSAGVYMADAIPQRLPLVSLGAALSGGGEAKHDWHFVFGQLGLLPASGFIGTALRVIGMVAATAGVIFAAWLLYKMYQAPRWATSTNEVVLATSPSDRPKPHPQPLKDDGFTSLPLSTDDAQPPHSNQPNNHP